MPDPRVAAFQKAWDTNPDSIFRNDLKKAFAEGIMQGNTQPIALGILRETSNAIGEDLTELFSKEPFVAPITPQESADLTQGAIQDKAPWYRRAFNKALAVAEWEQENIAEPSAALVLEQLFNLYPGEQNFERNLDIVRRDIQRERVQENKEFTIADHFRASREAYNRTNMAWGLKGFSELIFDPINLVGAGLPAKASKAAPALKPILFPARVIDEAPQWAAKQLFRGAGQLKKLPIVESLAKPHWTSQVNESRRITHQSVTDAFGPLIASDNPADTAALFNNLTRFPEDAGPYSLRNILNHVGAGMGDEPFNRFMDTLKTKTPKQAADTLSELIAGQEARALRQGGERLSGELITESISERRIGKLDRIFQRLALDEKHSKALAQGIDSHIFGWIENTYLRKIEPNLVRPWALSHLAFVGYLPMNIVEDIGMSTVGMGVTGKFGVGDAEFNLMKAGLAGGAIPPQHLTGAEGQARNIINIQTGQFKETQKGSIAKIAENTVGLGIKMSGKWGWAYRRGTWVNKFHQEFNKALTEVGIAPQEIDNLRNLVHSEFPEGMDHLRDELGAKVWAMMSTGDPAAVRQVKDIVSSTRVTQKAQAAIMTEFPNMPPDVRKTFFRAVFEEGGITATNADIVSQGMRENLLEWHKFSSEGIKARLGDFVDALGSRSPQTATEAAGLLRMLQHAGDTIAALPREIRAHTKRVASNLQPGERDAVWQESLRIITEDVASVRQQYEEALKRSQPHINRLMTPTTRTGVQGEAVRRSIDSIFESYTAISRNLDETWQTFRAKTSEHFATVPKGQRDEAFWLQYEEIGNEVWGAEKLFRAEQANLARTGWNSLLDTLPANLTGKDREFMKAGLEATLGDARQRVDDLRIELNDLENAGAVPDSLIGERTQRIERVKEALVISAQHHKDLEKRLASFVKRRTSTKPSELRDYDKSIRALNTAIEEASKNGHDTVGAFQQQLAQTIAERDEAFESFVPVFLRPEWDTLQAQRTHLENLVEIGGRGSKARANELRSTNAAIRRFKNRIERGEGFSELQRISGATDTVLSGVAQSVLRASDGVIPQTIEDMTEAIAQLADQGDGAAVAFVEAQESLAVRFGDTSLSEAREGGEAAVDVSTDELLQRAFTRVVETAERPALTPNQLQRLRDASTRDLFPDRALVNLVEDGLVTSPTKLRDGKWRVDLTERGTQTLDFTQDQSIDIAQLVEGLPDPVREFDTVIDQMWNEMDGAVQKAVDIADNPPYSPAATGRVEKYIDDMADNLERDPNLRSRLKVARQTAGERTNASYDEFFINYDNRNTLDFVMQRFMPFWMYESRRFPRLIKLAAKRPILAKHYTMLMGDWDYGYTPTPFGFEFNPAKGAITNQLRRTVSRDFPELHGGYRGAVEEGLDWLGRGGFYFAPPISGAVDLLQGEPGSITPPPISLLLHAMSASGANLPGPLADLAFDARYLQFQVDSTLADMGHNPTEIRRRVNDGEDEAAGIFYAARHKASEKIIATSQSSVLRYRPESKREFISGSQQAVEDIIGMTVADQEELRKLGIHVYEVTTVSGFQRKLLREAIPNYDAWIGASIALRPLEEQKAIRLIDEFWAEHSRRVEIFEAAIKELSDDWESGDLSGPEARRELSELNRSRALMLDTLRATEKFKSVPLTLDDRQEYAKKFNKPPQLAHPVDELLEGYYAINAESPAFKDDIEGETDWNKFFDAREQHLNSAVPQVQSIARDALMRADTPLERMLKVSAPWLKEYYGIRTTFTEQAEDEAPNVTLAYREYRRLQNLANITVDPEVSASFRQDAIDIAAQFPIVQRIESGVRTWRKDFRAGDPTMESVFQMFMASPGTAPTVGTTSRRSFGVRPVTGIRQGSSFVVGR